MSVLRKVSKKRAKLNREYSKIRNEWIKGKKCARCGTERNLTVHHSKGKQGYANEEKRLMDIHLLVDTDYFVALCLTCHIHVEKNPNEARDNGWSVSRGQR